METPSKVDLPLFAGDLLGSWSLASEHVASEGNQDGWREADHVFASSPSEVPSPITGIQGYNSFESDWLDTRVDLLDYLAGPELEGLQHDPVTAVVTEDPTARAVQVLKSIAEDNNSLLSESTSNHASEVPTTPDLSHDRPNFDCLDLLNDSDLDPSILVPMSPEDIDSILSSGPGSPVCEADISLVDSLGSLDSSNELDISGNSSYASQELLQLLQQVQSNEDCVPEEICVQAINTPPSPQPQESSLSCRPKPYERPRKPGSVRGHTREAIQQERKLRKKQQNKDAATRYRQKKKAEADTVNQELSGLEQRNTFLKDQVDSMTNEISYLKDLLAEVYAARGLSVQKKSK